MSKIESITLDESGVWVYNKYTHMGYISVRWRKGGIMQEKECCCCRKKLNPRTDKEKSALIGRLNRISGQINGIAKMIDADRYCGDVLVQLAAVYKSVKSLSSAILEEHMKSCVTESIKKGETEAIEEVLDLFQKFA